VIVKRTIASGLAGMLLAAGVAACGSDDESESSTGTSARTGSANTAQAEPTAGVWKTWVISSPAEVPVPSPPAPGSPEAQADLAEVEKLAGERPPQVRETVEKYSGAIPAGPWNEVAFDFVSKAEKNPPLSSRNYALVNAAMYDAMVAAWHWKYHYNVRPPTGGETLVPAGADPSYPSEHAAMAGAASRVLASLYPNQSALRLDEMAEEAARSRVQAGTNTPSDTEAGLALGRAVADKVIAYSQTDGAQLQWDGQRPPGIGGGPAYWEPPPGTVSPPTEPRAGEWKAWVLTSNNQFRPGPPPVYGSPEFVAAAREVMDAKANLTDEQRRIALYWAGAEGSALPAGIVIQTAMPDIAEANLTIPRSTRAMTLLAISQDDAGIAAWDAKFTYWNPRPENAIRDLGLDPNWTPLVPTPRFPAYPSGSAGYAGASESVLTYLFPEKAAEFRRRAEEQARSRVYAGIHWSYDAVSIDAGRQIGNLVVGRAKTDGADG
jgi:membrane-associated phospholipid phosphatase